MEPLINRFKCFYKINNLKWICKILFLNNFNINLTSHQAIDRIPGWCNKIILSREENIREDEDKEENIQIKILNQIWLIIPSINKKTFKEESIREIRIFLEDKTFRNMVKETIKEKPEEINFRTNHIWIWNQWSNNRWTKINLQMPNKNSNFGNSKIIFNLKTTDKGWKTSNNNSSWVQTSREKNSIAVKIQRMNSRWNKNWILWNLLSMVISKSFLHHMKETLRKMTPSKYRKWIPKTWTSEAVLIENNHLVISKTIRIYSPTKILIWLIINRKMFLTTSNKWVKISVNITVKMKTRKVRMMKIIKSF